MVLADIQIHHMCLEKILDLGLDVTQTTGRVAHRDRGLLLEYIAELKLELETDESL